jgi:hypothetical protein
MPARRTVLFVALVALVTGLSIVPAHAKVLNGCAVLAQEELETIFEQPFAKGEVLQGQYCQFAKPSSAEVPNILVQVLVTRYKDVPAAERAFDRQETTSTELAGGVTPVRRVGDEAFSTVFLGVDQITVRAGKVVGHIRVDEPDSDATFADQVLAVAEAAAPRLRNYSKAA